MKRIAILGSTGSIGVNALKVVDDMPGEFEVVGLAAHSNGELLAKQAKRHRPKMVTLFDHEASLDLKAHLDGGARHLPSGVEGLCELASHPDVDVVLTSLVGGVGFAPLLAAIRAGKTIALANKEPMVMAGAQFMKEAARWEATIVPVDSEPSAIFQCVQGAPRSLSSAAPHGGVAQPNLDCLKIGPTIRRVFLTASGGAFYKRKGSLSSVTVAEALNHPTWKMGKKITIDCATLMNKGFESIEIMNLFGLKREQVQIVIHPQSIIHSGVEFSDGSVLTQLSPPDMRLPIQYAMTFPARSRCVVERLDFFKVGRLDFSEPDFRRFLCLELSRAAAKAGGGMPAVLNAADEVAVESFIQGRICFTDIPRLIERTMKAYRPAGGLPSFSEVVEIEQWARKRAQETCNRL